jgi:hypothetical protein
VASANERFERAVARFEADHVDDPRTVEVDGAAVAWSALYHERLAHWVERLDPGASEALRLAARCQHIRRWTIPRAQYPDGGAGYKRWRSSLARFHAERAAEILRDVGYDEATVGRVQELLQKRGLGRDPEVQRFEDAICMVFLETELAEFAAKHERAKVIDVLQKTWAKMSDAGRACARAFRPCLAPELGALVDEAVAGVAAPRG